MSETSVGGLVEELLECSDSDLDDGHRSLKAYLRATCTYSDAEAARVGRLTAVTSGLPGVAEALHHGHIDTPQANELAVAHTNPRVRDRLGDFAPMLLELAEPLSFREFRTCVQRFVMLADLDGAHHDRDASVANRRAQVVNLNAAVESHPGARVGPASGRRDLRPWHPIQMSASMSGEHRHRQGALHDHSLVHAVQAVLLRSRHHPHPRCLRWGRR